MKIVVCMIAVLALSACGQTKALPQCATEDSTGCMWHAKTQGNGLGHDVTNPKERS